MIQFSMDTETFGKYSNINKFCLNRDTFYCVLFICSFFTTTDFLYNSIMYHRISNTLLVGKRGSDRNSRTISIQIENIIIY